MTLAGMLPELSDEHRKPVETLIAALPQKDEGWIERKMEGLQAWLTKQGY